MDEGLMLERVSTNTPLIPNSPCKTRFPPVRGKVHGRITSLGLCPGASKGKPPGGRGTLYGSQGYRAHPTERPKEKYAGLRMTTECSHIACRSHLRFQPPSEADPPDPPSRNQLLRKAQKAYRQLRRASRSQALGANPTCDRCRQRLCPHPLKQLCPRPPTLEILVHLHQQEFLQCNQHQHARR